MNAAVGGSSLTPSPAPDYPIGRTYPAKGLVKSSDLGKNPGPAMIFVMLCEHPDSINDGIFFFNAGFPPSGYEWRDLPGSLHNGADSLSFADGHSEIRKWLDGVTRQPVKMQTKWYAPGGNLNCPHSVDYAWMNDRMPYEQ
jgi:hypothetical protein